MVLKQGFRHFDGSMGVAIRYNGDWFNRNKLGDERMFDHWKLKHCCTVPMGNSTAALLYCMIVGTR